MTQDRDIQMLDVPFPPMQNVPWVDHYIPQGSDMFYYEVLILESNIMSIFTHGGVIVGFETRTNLVSRLSITEDYRPFSPMLSSMEKVAKPSIHLPSHPMVSRKTSRVLTRYPGWQAIEGDIVGCGVDFDDHIIFFTKNGVLMGVATFDIFDIRSVETLIPAVELTLPTSLVSFNFGCHPFRWNPPGKSDRIDCSAIPRSFFNEYDAFFVAATFWIRANEGIEISCDGRVLKKSRLTTTSNSVTARATSDIHMNGQGISYYEVEVLQVHRDGLITIGFEVQPRLPTTSAGSHLGHAVGAVEDSGGYNSDGVVSRGKSLSDRYGPKFHSSDIIGCGMVPVSSPDHMASVFYTLNGSFLGTFFDLANTALNVVFPFVSLCDPDDAVRANFGQEPFRYPIGRIVRDFTCETQWPRLSKPRTLPSEVIGVILAALVPNDLDHSYNKKHIAWCALVCRHWYRKCSPYLFKTIKLHSKGDMNILYARIEKPGSHIPGASITSLTLNEGDGDVWAYNVALSMANKLPHLHKLHQARENAYDWKVIRSRIPPRISTSLPALYSAYTMVTTFILENHRFRSFAAFTQLISALPVLETLKCKYVTWEERPNNPRLLRAPRRLSTIEIALASRQSGQMFQLFTARWGAWKPTSKYPELGCNDSKLIHGMVDIHDPNIPDPFGVASKIRFATFADEWRYTFVWPSWKSTWDLTFSSCGIQDGPSRTCLTNLRIITYRGFLVKSHLHYTWCPWANWLNKTFSEAPPPFLENVTIVSEEKTTFIKQAIEASKLRSCLPHLQQAGKLRFVWKQYIEDEGTKEWEITEEDERAAVESGYGGSIMTKY